MWVYMCDYIFDKNKNNPYCYSVSDTFKRDILNTKTQSINTYILGLGLYARPLKNNYKINFNLNFFFLFFNHALIFTLHVRVRVLKTEYNLWIHRIIDVNGCYGCGCGCGWVLFFVAKGISFEKKYNN